MEESRAPPRRPSCSHSTPLGDEERRCDVHAVNADDRRSTGSRAQSPTRLVCLAPAGAGAAFYRDWPAEIAGMRVEPADLPGRGGRAREPLLRTVSEMAGAVAGSLGTAGEPWNLFGHSLGAAVAFEVVRAVRASGGTEPNHLVVSGRPAPQAPCTRPLLHTLPRGDFLAAVLDHGGTPTAVAENAELMHVLEPVLRADFRASETYAWDGTDPVDCTVVVVVAAQDPLFVPREALAWRNVTRGPFRAVHLDGDHFHARRPVPTLLEVLEETAR
ncbi:MAG: thioesterase II family protein [Dermatophilaceae bacterium]